ncbi:hypothetical protein BD310DRAFT_979961 [Dichomitus squalens]|uniref:Uncharacterized protein n=1 Tax=Dichomitus squalens TaxID=114155 RepID=A0A4V2K766_9APHY|nr:hypothetical protein BD310DRAFT_979961 [Dichomitus squalens]
MHLLVQETRKKAHILYHSGLWQNGNVKNLVRGEGDGDAQDGAESARAADVSSTVPSAMFGSSTLNSPLYPSTTAAAMNVSEAG